MKPRSQLGRVVSMELAGHGQKQVWLAHKTGVNQGTLSRLMSGNMRPDIETLAALCGAWPDRVTCVRVLIAHLEDEVERAGMNPGEVEIRPSDAPAITEAAAIVDHLAKYDPELLAHVMSLIRNIARLVVKEQPVTAPRIAAENRPGYGKKGGKA